MNTHRETLAAPLSWWVGAVAFAATCGWILLVATTVEAGIAAFVIVALGLGVLLWRSGLRISVDGHVLRVGNAHLESRWWGEPLVLTSTEYRARLGVQADARAYLATRPWADRGVLLPVTDPADSVPYWVIGSADPARLAAALTAVLQTGTTAGGKE